MGRAPRLEIPTPPPEQIREEFWRIMRPRAEEWIGELYGLTPEVFAPVARGAELWGVETAISPAMEEMMRRLRYGERGIRTGVEAMGERLALQTYLQNIQARQQMALQEAQRRAQRQQALLQAGLTALMMFGVPAGAGMKAGMVGAGMGEAFTAPGFPIPFMV